MPDGRPCPDDRVRGKFSPNIYSQYQDRARPRWGTALWITVRWLPAMVRKWDLVAAKSVPGWRKTADARDLKSCGGISSVWVRLPLRAPL